MIAPLNILVWQMGTRQTAVHYQYNQCNFLLDKICRKHHWCFMSFVSRSSQFGVLISLYSYNGIRLIRLIISHIGFLSDDENHKLVKLRQRMRAKQRIIVHVELAALPIYARWVNSNKIQICSVHSWKGINGQVRHSYIAFRTILSNIHYTRNMHPVTYWSVQGNRQLFGHMENKSSFCPGQL